jgi:SP family sugar:H+ symporter-like MFS transporter
MAFVDRIGRKPILLFGSIGMAVTLAVVAVAFSSATLVNGQAQLPQLWGVVALVAANLYVVFFNGTWGPVMWVMLGEMFPNQIRGSGLAVSGFAQWAANFAIALSFPVAAKALGLVPTYGFYALSALVSFFFVRAMVHETRGRELEQMVG